MPIYKCNSCLKEFNRKCNYDDHINKKKKPCLLSNIQNTFTAQNGTNTAQNGTTLVQLLQKDVKQEKNSCYSIHKDSLNFINEQATVNTDDTNIFCEYCNKIFLRKDSLTRHLKKFCKYKKQNDNKDLIIEKLVEEISILKELLKKDNLVQNMTNNNTNNNTNSHNKTINNIQNNVQLNISGFGKEDLEKLDIREAMNIYLKSTGSNIIPNMLNYINLNKNYPENHNICMTDISREIVKIHNGKKYIYKKFKI